MPEKEQNLRLVAASQIREMRRLEREEGWVLSEQWNRDVVDYLDSLNGIYGLLNYLKELGNSSILDIGAGGKRAITELAKGKLGRDFNFYATILTGDTGSEISNLAFRKTSAEALRGIEDSSIGLVLASSSIAYSKAMPLVVESVDRVLIPGGVIKSVFKESGQSHSRDLRQTSGEAEKLFSLKGYDIFSSNGIMLAVKSGFAKARSASSLYKSNSTFMDIVALYNQAD